MMFNWHCIPFDLKSIKKPDCKQKIADGAFNCAGCNGRQLINISEGIDMSKKKLCIIEGCSSPLWKGDWCYKHHPDTIEAKKNNPNSMENRSIKVNKEAMIPAPVSIDHTPPPIKTIEQATAEHTALYERDEAHGSEVQDYLGGEDEPILPDNFGKVINGDGDYVSFGVDEFVYLAIDEAMEAKKREWLVDLSGVSPIKAVGRLAGMVKAVQGLGY